MHLSSYEFALALIFLQAICVSSSLPPSNSSSIISNELEKELKLTKEEKLALDKLKAVLPTKGLLDYMKVDLFLMRWLRAKNLNVERARKELFELIEFRRKNKVEDFAKEDWSDVFPQSPFTNEGHDREGRPIGYLTFGDHWDVRRIILQGKRERMNLFIVNLVLELVEGRLMPIHRQHPNITQFVVLFNVDGFSIAQHGCPSCVLAYTYLLEVYERYVPGFAHDIVFINAPSRYSVAIELFRPILSEYTSKALKVFGTNKRQWKPFLDSKISPDQLPYEFGGIKGVE